MSEAKSSCTSEEKPEVRECRRCGISKPIDNFEKHYRVAGHRNICKQCRRSYIRKKRQSDEYKSKATQWYHDNKEKKRANGKIERALLTGRIVRPSSCEKCGATGVKIDASHTDYSKPLDVEWLCRSCHRRKDLKLSRSRREADAETPRS